MSHVYELGGRRYVDADDYERDIGYWAEETTERQRLECESAQLRADLATVTAERNRQMARGDDYYSEWQAERVAHAETRKALESSRAQYGCYKHSAMQTVGLLRIQLDSTRAELAKAEARVKELESAVNGWFGR